MELTNAQRQAKHRDKQKYEAKNRRLNVWVNARVMTTLETLANGHGATQRQVLEALILQFHNDLFLNEELAKLGKRPEKVGKKAKKCIKQ